MKQSLRYSFMAQFALAAGAAVASCSAEAPGEIELARHSAELRSAGELAAAASEDGEADPPSECECGPLISWPPPECPRTRWFCNAAGDCACAPPSVGSLLESEVAPVTSTRAARIMAPREPELSDLPLLDDGGDDCKCLGATVSPPQGGCALEDWYCNASGLCRCRS